MEALVNNYNYLATCRIALFWLVFINFIIILPYQGWAGGARFIKK